MKKFLINFVLFGSIIFAVSLSVELIVEKIPNTYSYKYDWMVKNSNSIETLVLGNSQAYKGINTAFFTHSGFNFSIDGQGLKVDKFLFDKFVGVSPNLKCVVLPIGYHSLVMPSTYGSADREMYSTVYYGLNDRPLFSTDSYELFFPASVKGKINLRYFKKKNTVICDSLGCDINALLKNKDAISDNSEEVLKWYTAPINSEIVNVNIGYLNAIAKKCSENGIKLILLTMPVDKGFYENANKMQLKLMYKTVNQLNSEFECVYFFDFLKDQRFTKNDFFDSYHLTTDVGTVKFSKILNDSINKLVY